MDNDVRNLIQFLAEDCGWPLDEDQIDRSAWPVNNSELGLNDEVSVESVEIYELRPLTTNQPWGVFFLAVKGTSKLSITLLRKLLRGLVKKKRASADTSNLQQWDLEDLMFVCSLDEPENTTRYFAHFKEQEKGLPKLMIGARWEDSQPENEIKAAKLKLKSNLKWPDNENDIDSWRKLWSKAFPVGHREVIKSSSDLANALAKYALIIQHNIPEIFHIEPESGPVHSLLESFKEALIDDLDIDSFADMVAQTITYGLFSARASGSQLIGIETLAESIPSTNPFLKELFYELSNLSGDEPTDLDFDDLALEELTSMLNNAQIDVILEDFGNQFKGGKEDPVIHFYETFLSKYDSKRRAERGVFYTPKPVVEFIVKSVHECLKNEHGLKLGIADSSTHFIDGVEWPKVIILDPATGTGTFIESAIDLIHETMTKHWKDDGASSSEINELWNDYVESKLLTRIFGFELMMAPYAIAHLKIGLKLRETGYSFKSDTRLNIFLTNSLTEPKPIADWLPGFISKESKSANSVKSRTPITVIIGNPPYSGESMNNSKWIHDLMRSNLSNGSHDYFSFKGKPLAEKNVKWINDDYVKFLRMSQNLISESKFGVVGMITNNGYFDNPTFRGMRTSLMHTFSSISVIDLHGSANKKEKTPNGSKDENVFDIRTGVGIGIFSKIQNDENFEIRHCDVWGLRNSKYDQLYSIISNPDKLSKITPGGDFYLFTPVDEELSNEYECGIKLTEIMPLHSAGIATGRDKFTLKWTLEEITKTMSEFVQLPVEKARVKYNLRKDVQDWKVHWAQNDVRKTRLLAENYVQISYRPFDSKYTYYTGNSNGIHCRPRPKVMKQMLMPNIGFAVSRSVRGAPWRDVLITEKIMEFGYIATRPGNTAPLFPLYVYDLKNKAIESRKYNFKSNFLNSIDSHLSRGVDPEDLFYYIYSILNSNQYRKRYSEFIAIDFPKIPFTSDYDLFSKISKKGRVLATTQLMKNTEPLSQVTLKGEGNNVVGVMSEKSHKGNRLYINETQYFDGVGKNLYNYHIGSYRICHKWLKDRKGQKLSNQDVLHYRKMMSVIEQTTKLSDELDELISVNGGFPLHGSTNFSYDDKLPEGQKTLF